MSRSFVVDYYGTGGIGGRFCSEDEVPNYLKSDTVWRLPMHRGDMTTFPLWTAGSRHIPDYYKWTVRDLEGNKVTFDIYELLLQMETGPAFAAKHLLRAGRKDGVPIAQDISKCMEELERWMEREAGK